MILVDTCIWSEALRKKKSQNREAVLLLKQAIIDNRVHMMGAIRQEILSGIKDKKTFNTLKEKLRAFPDLLLAEEDFELAADYFNLCRKKGIQGSNTDFLICSVATNRNLEIFTSDEDFKKFKKFIPIRLFD